jgi:hypothetical protein
VQEIPDEPEIKKEEIKEEILTPPAPVVHIQ